MQRLRGSSIPVHALDDQFDQLRDCRLPGDPFLKLVDSIVNNQCETLTFRSSEHPNLYVSYIPSQFGTSVG